MLELLLSYWWAALAIVGVAAYFAVRFMATRRFDSMVQDVLSEAQEGFSRGNVEVHSVKAAGTMKVQDETAILYHIDATITPSDDDVEWRGTDLFLRGIDGDPNQIGDVMTVKQWKGESFEQIKNGTQLSGTQRLLLSMRFAGSPGKVRFNFNFANFGQVFQLPEVEIAV